ncbi:MAG: glycosyltransferase family 39 protein [Rhodopila sp.]|nr:glycosyltransferase family 39 protein [Rhodopila sp.]
MCAVMLLAALVLTAAACLRSAEYDEQYTLFLTAGTPRPGWPETVFPAGTVAAVQAGHASLAGIAQDLRATDVHPPLYFWAVSVWRRMFGPGLFAARMMSVLCGLVSLSMVGMIARRCAVGPVPAMLLTLGCYGFVYTNAIARGFAPAQMLTLCGIVLLLGRRPLLAGAFLGVACCCNYLAVFVAVAAVIVGGAWPALPTAVPFLAVDAWFFVAQHAARPGQFPPFTVGPSLVRLAGYEVAGVFGGLPLYVDGGWRVAVGAIVGALAAGLVVLVALSRPLSAGPAIRLVLAAAVAPPFGLLLLGAAFNNTPIELRYLSFGLPFIALLAAWVCRSHRCRCIVMAVQFAAILGLLLAPRTMQPARAAATEAARLVGDGIVLLPRGNDGVGIVGAFGIEAPPALPLLLVRPTDPIFDRVAPYRRVVLAQLSHDPDSSATLPILRAAFARPNWRRVAIGSNLEVYERTDDGG